MGARDFRILVADDVPANRLLLKRILEREGHEVIEAENGSETLACFESCTFDIALLDVMMPDVDGFTICRRVRQRFSPKELPILFITAKTQDQDFQEGFDAGANDYITKPVNSTILLARLNAQIRFLSAYRALQCTYAELSQTKQMETVGLFATGVAHNFNNILGTILGCAELVEIQARGNEKLLRASQLILKAAKKGAELTDSLITFARPAENRICMDPLETVRSAAKLIPELWTTQVEFDLEAPNDVLPPVVVSAVDLAQVVIELLRNAVESLHGPGQVMLRLSSVQSAEHTNGEPRDSVEIAIRDTGRGMSAEQLSSVFTPFYSTKNIDSLMGIALDGSGLGLSRVYNIITAAGGTVRFTESSIHGTTVVVSVPAATGAPARTPRDERRV